MMPKAHLLKYQKEQQLEMSHGIESGFKMENPGPLDMFIKSEPVDMQSWNPLTTLADISLALLRNPSWIPSGSRHRLLTPSPSPPLAHNLPMNLSLSSSNIINSASSPQGTPFPPPAHENLPASRLTSRRSSGGSSDEEEENKFYYSSEEEEKGGMRSPHYKNHPQNNFLFNARRDLLLYSVFPSEAFEPQSLPQDLRIPSKKRDSDCISVTSTSSSSSICESSISTDGSGCNSNKSKVGLQCPDCGKSYSTSSNLARHRQTHRSIEDKKARKCPHCDKTYVSMPAYSMHIRTHNQGCKCPFCGKCFSRPWLLQGHIRTHTGEKPFTCNICEKAFADKSNLRAHIQTHSNTKPYVCSKCNKAFALKSYLYKHEESSCMKVNRKGTKVRNNEGPKVTTDVNISDLSPPPSSPPPSLPPQQMFLETWRQVALLSNKESRN
ncbi:uncharacterized protein [Lepeophtheirus salmonis]|uniref:uncharacterized protein n=1 Tax=Lepeophtheirus salmonis TaxID=72036 RepID=UPI001AE60D4A|nr:zinc finger protein SNAI1-like [Lepeophtheirus salmonis]